MYNTMVCINECYIPYSGKLSREKTFANCEKYDFYEENIRGLLTFAAPKNITEKTFTNSLKATKFAKIFSLKSFLLYDKC